MVTKIQIVNTQVGSVLVSGSADGTLRLWDYQNEKQPHIFAFSQNVRIFIIFVIS
jgi:WD40 repeat protein